MQMIASILSSQTSSQISLKFSVIFMKISNLQIMWNIIVQISFLEVLTRIVFLIRSNGKLETTVFPKETNYLAGTKLHSQFNIKNDTNAQYKHAVVSFSRWPSTNGTDSYKRGISWYLSVRIVDQAGRDTNTVAYL